MSDFKAIPLEPIGERVIVRRDRVEKQRTDSGLILVGSNATQTLSNKSSFGVVVAVGPDLKQVKLGDRVFIGTNYGYPIDYRFNEDDDEVRISQEADYGITAKNEASIIIQDKAEYVVLREIDIQYIVRDEKKK